MAALSRRWRIVGWVTGWGGGHGKASRTSIAPQYGLACLCTRKDVLCLLATMRPVTPLSFLCLRSGKMLALAHVFKITRCCHVNKDAEGAA